MNIFDISDEQTFRATALEVFQYQATSVPVYRDYLDALKVEPKQVTGVEQIPFLPIVFFKTHTVLAGDRTAGEVFESSGTTGAETSRHHIADTALYRESFLRSFYAFYGSPEDYCILALLPSYLERKQSSLVYMMDHLIRWSGHPDSGFYLDNLDALVGVLQQRNNDGQKTLLLGVSFALLDLAEKHPMALWNNITIMETGGMKGRRESMVRSELHARLKEAFDTPAIHSEYGMTELLSQAWSQGEGLFLTPPWMDILIRDTNDPLSLVEEGRTGGINVIDLANRYSCAFVATDDLGKRHEDGSFEVLGRFDQSDIRGCNLLVS